MKKTISIILLFFFLFNIVGYKVFFFYLEHVANTRIETKIETLKDMDNELITVKIPIRLPYQTNWKDFERTDGEMTFKGITYKYVKRKVQNDTLILLCIKFNDKSVIQKNSNEYFKKINALTSEANKKPVIKQTKNDFYEELKDASILLFDLYQHSFSFQKGDSCTPGYLPFMEIPPEFRA